jgi:curli production assembly/transport component CsgG
MKRLLSTLLMITALSGLQGCGLREPMPAEQDSETPTLTPGPRPTTT